MGYKWPNFCKLKNYLRVPSHPGHTSYQITTNALRTCDQMCNPHTADSNVKRYNYYGD